MSEVTIIGVDLAKNVFQVHGAAADGSFIFRKNLSRPQFARFIADRRASMGAGSRCAREHLLCLASMVWRSCGTG